MGLDIFINKIRCSEIGYFRKFNFLVKFFLEKGLDVENQISLEINKNDIKELLSKCEEVLKDHSKAPELLPTMSGFFFGNTKYNEYYYNDVKYVRNYIKNKLLPEFDNLRENEQIYFNISY